MCLIQSLSEPPGNRSATRVEKLWPDRAGEGLRVRQQHPIDLKTEPPELSSLCLTELTLGVLVHEVGKALALLRGQPSETHGHTVLGGARGFAVSLRASRHACAYSTAQIPLSALMPTDGDR